MFPPCFTLLLIVSVSRSPQIFFPSYNQVIFLKYNPTALLNIPGRFCIAFIKTSRLPPLSCKALHDPGLLFQAHWRPRAPPTCHSSHIELPPLLQRPHSLSPPDHPRKLLIPPQPTLFHFGNLHMTKALLPRWVPRLEDVPYQSASTFNFSSHIMSILKPVCSTRTEPCLSDPPFTTVPKIQNGWGICQINVSSIRDLGILGLLEITLLSHPP